MTIDNFEDAVAEANAKGYRVHNCFERDVHRGVWQANLFAPGEKTYSQFGIAATPHGAIMEALKGAPDIAPPSTLTEMERQAAAAVLRGVELTGEWLRDHPLPTPTINLFD